MPPIEIDLNADAANYDNGDDIVYLHATEASYGFPSLNFSPNSNTNEVPSPNLLVLDLNSDPVTIEDADNEPEIDNENDNTGSSHIDMPETPEVVKRYRLLNNDERESIRQIILQNMKGGKLDRGIIKWLAEIFKVRVRTIARIWKIIKGNENASLCHRRKGNCGRKRNEFDTDKFHKIPLHRRTTLASSAFRIEMPKTTLFRHLKYGDIRRHTNAIKSYLKEENKISRLRFCLSMLDQHTIPHDPVFQGMHNIVYIDEKWFYITKTSENYYLLQDEQEPIRTCKSKNFIGKVMFLAAVARPRFDEEGNEIFSGKIGVFPFVTQVPAKRSSVNKVAGTVEIKPITSVTKQIVKAYIIEKVLPAIKEKWPRNDVRNPIFIQQDNARTHINPNDEDFRQVATMDGFDIRLICQPPNSPHLNILDLGFFNAVQSLQSKMVSKSFEELVGAVEKSFEDFSTISSNFIFLSLQLCMVEIMKAKGSNGYKTPHMKKDMLRRASRLPTQIKCDSTVVQEILNMLVEGS